MYVKIQVGKDTDSDIIDFHGSDFDENKLKLHKDIIIDIGKSRKIPIYDTLDIIKLLTI